MNCSCSPPKEKQTMHSLQQSPFLYPQTLRVCFNKWNEDKGHGKTTSDGHLLLGHQPLSLQAFHLVVVNWFVAVSVARCQGKVMDLGPPPEKKVLLCWILAFKSRFLACRPRLWGLCFWEVTSHTQQLLKIFRDNAVKSYCRRICLGLSLEVSARGR